MTGVSTSAASGSRPTRSGFIGRLCVCTIALLTVSLGTGDGPWRSASDGRGSPFCPSSDANTLAFDCRKQRRTRTTTSSARTTTPADTIPATAPRESKLSEAPLEAARVGAASVVTTEESTEICKNKRSARSIMATALPRYFRFPTVPAQSRGGPPTLLRRS